MNVQTILQAQDVYETTQEVFEIPEELTRFWYDVCNEKFKFAIEISAQYEEYINTQISLLKALICNRPHVESNKNNLQLAKEILHKFSGSLALLGFTPQSHRIHSLEQQFVNQTASLDQTTFNYIQSQVQEVSTLIRQYILQAGYSWPIH